MTPFKKRGFTLIELLVVISIIGLLSSVVLSTVNSARAKARDTQRIQALKEINKAIIFYYDKYGYYPLAQSISFNVANSAIGIRWTSLETTLQSEGFISSLQRDPINNGSMMTSSTGYSYRYQVASGGQAYNLITRLETAHPSRCEGSKYTSNITTPNGSMALPYLMTAGTPLCPHIPNETTYNYNYLYFEPH